MKRCIALFLGIIGSVIVCSSVSALFMPPTETTLEVYLPHLTGGASGADWTDYLQADNNGTDPAGFTLNIYDGTGMQIFTKSFTVPGRSKLLIDIKKEATSLGSTGVITYTDPALGFRLSYEYKTGGLAEFYLTDTLKTSMVLYFSDFSSVITTKGVAISNMTGSSKTVTMYAVGGGQILGQTQFTLLPFGRTVGGPSTYFGGTPGIDAATEKLIVVAESACLDGLTIGTDATLAHAVFIPGQEALGFVPPGGALFSFYDGFDSNENNWDLFNTADATAKIASGKLQLDNWNFDGWWRWWIDALQGLDESKNFTIETSITNTYNESIFDAYGLFWGRLNDDNLFDFNIYIDGYFEIWKNENGVWTILQSGYAASFDTSNDPTNILKIKKVGSTLYFYINNTQIHSMPYQPFFGNQIGYFVGGDQSISVDYLSITEDP